MNLLMGNCGGKTERKAKGRYANQHFNNFYMINLKFFLPVFLCVKSWDIKVRTMFAKTALINLFLAARRDVRCLFMCKIDI